MVTFDDNDLAEPDADGADLPPVRGFLPSTLIDWPGRIAAIAFLPGCNLRCPYCHAGDLLEPVGDELISWAQLRSYLEEKRSWIDGLVICGGEPTLHPTLDRLCRAVHDLGLAVKLDTNGTHPEVLSRLIAAGLLDAVSMDLKTALDERMVRLARREVDLEAIDRSVSLLLDAAAPPAAPTNPSPFKGEGGPDLSGPGEGDARPNHPAPRDVHPTRVSGDPEHCRKDVGESDLIVPGDQTPRGLEVEFRTTCCPAFVDREVVEWIARRIGPTPGRPAGSRYVLQRFESEHCLDPAFRELAPYGAAEMEEFLAAAQAINPDTRLRTG